MLNTDFTFYTCEVLMCWKHTYMYVKILSYITCFLMCLWRFTVTEINCSEYWGPKVELPFSRENWHLLLPEDKEYLETLDTIAFGGAEVIQKSPFHFPHLAGAGGHEGSLSSRHTTDFCSQSKAFTFTYHSPLEVSVHWYF